jgi:MFS family permease
VKSTAVAVKPRFSFQQTFAALKYRNYRLWFFGQIISLFGTWMQNTAQGFLVYELTKSPAFLGYVGFAAGIPSWLFMLYGGVIADRISRRKLMVITQSTMMILAFILSALTFLKVVQPWHIILLAFLLGIANAFDTPARQAFASELVDREDLTNAIALNSSMFNSATVVGPALAGVTYAAFGPGWCFAINGISFIAVIIALLFIRFDRPFTSVEQRSMFKGLKAGFQYVIGEPAVRTLIMMIGVFGLFGASYMTLMPAWAVDVLQGDVKTNGLLRSAQGAGALIGALIIASLGRFKFRGKLLTFGSFCFPILLMIFAYIRWIPASLLMLVGVGLSTVMIMNLANALVQITVPDNLRGRVMGIYSLTFFGLMPIGSLLMGMIADKLSEPIAVLFGTTIVIGCAILVRIFAPSVWKLE